MVLLMGIVLTFYFCYHLLQGERSYFRLLSLNQSIQALEKERLALHDAQEKLDLRVGMLRAGSVNKDLLEERVRFVLGYRHPDEMDVLRDSIPTKP